MGIWARSVEVVVTDPFWKDRRVLVTGHTGFKGAWLSLWLETLGATVVGAGLHPEHPDGAYPALEPWSKLDSRLVDLRDENLVTALVQESQPEIVFHLAAQSLVRRGFKEPALTFSTNVASTANILAAAGSTPSTAVVVVVTSDKVYAQSPNTTGAVEGDELRGRDPYSSSKVCVELLVDSWRSSFPAPPVLVTARAGNVIGGGDRGEDRLVPDVLLASDEDRPVRLRNPDAVRPWQFVLEPLGGYLRYAEFAATEPDRCPPSLNFGPEPHEADVSVSELVELLLKIKGRDPIWEPETETGPPESAVLRLDPSLAGRTLGWKTRASLEDSLRWTVEWHESQQRGADVRELSLQQIGEFETLRNS